MADLIIKAEVDDPGQSFQIEAAIGRLPAEYAWSGLTISMGGKPILTVPKERQQGARFADTIAIEELRTMQYYDVRIEDDHGNDLTGGLSYGLAGELFEAMSIDTTHDFFHKVQLNHLRFQSPLVLEIAARAAFARFDGQFTVQAAALTIIAHRYLEMPIATLRAQERHVSWLLEQAMTIVIQGEAAIDRAAAPDWEIARWTISLATVGGYLALTGDRYVRAERFFAVPVRYVELVALSRVSALNIVTGCFVHGLVSHILGRADVARTSLTTGVQCVPALVAAQDLMENVWVMGDLMNVIRAARQCYIALARLKLIDRTSTAGTPIIDGSAQILVSDVTGPLHAILLGGRGALLSRAIVGTGGTI